MHSGFPIAIHEMLKNYHSARGRTRHSAAAGLMGQPRRFFFSLFASNTKYKIQTDPTTIRFQFNSIKKFSYFQ
jgi:hypothetical protein